MIRIKPSATADTRTADDFKAVTKDQLLKSSKQHIGDVRMGLQFFQKMLSQAILKHDHDKLSDIHGFHRDFVTRFDKDDWLKNHVVVNRHHLMAETGVPEDVNLVDLIEMVVDCVMAGMGRSGNVYDLKLPPELLEKAFQNTVSLMKANVTVEDH